MRPARAHLLEFRHVGKLNIHHHLFNAADLLAICSVCARRVVADLPAVRRIALEALLDMRKHNVRYAELRTTPRILPDGTSPRAYIEAVLGVFRDFEYGQSTLSGDITSQSFGQKECTGTSRLIPRLLLSVDRGRTVEEAMYAVKLAIGLRDVVEWTPYVVGIDFSGNPTKGAFRDFRLGSASTEVLNIGPPKCKSWPSQFQMGSTQRYRLHSLASPAHPPSCVSWKSFALSPRQTGV